MKQEDLRKLLSLDSLIDITKVEIKHEGGKIVKLVYVKANKRKARCKSCNNFSHNVHDYLKPSKVTY